MRFKPQLKLREECAKHGVVQYGDCDMLAGRLLAHYDTVEHMEIQGDIPSDSATAASFSPASASDGFLVENKMDGARLHVAVGISRWMHQGSLSQKFKAAGGMKSSRRSNPSKCSFNTYVI